MKITLLRPPSRALSLRSADGPRPQQLPLNQTSLTPGSAFIGLGSSAFRYAEGGRRLISPADWIAEINRLVTVSKINWLEVAKVVIAAKRQLPRGHWSAMWDSKGAPFKKGKADSLVSIGKNLGDLNAQTSEQLPRGWTTLYQLSRLDRETLVKLIDDKTIRAGITYNEARDLVARFKGRRKRTTRANVIRRLQRFRDFVDATLNEWTSDERELVQTELSQVIAQIATVDSQKGVSPASATSRNEPLADALSFRQTNLQNIPEESTNALHLL